MGFLDLFKKNTKIEQERQRYLNTSSNLGYFNNNYNFNSFDLNSYIKEGYEKNPIIYSIVSMITSLSTNFNYKLRDKRTLKDVEDLEIDYVLNQPNQNQSFNEFITTELTYNLITGNSLVHYIKDEQGKVFQMDILPVDKVSTVIGADNVMYYSFNNINIDSNSVSLRNYPNLDQDIYENKLFGMSPIEPVSRGLQVSNQIYETQFNIIKNYGVSGILVGDASSNYTEDQLRDLQESVERRISNSDKAGSISVTSADMKYINFGQKASRT